MTTKPKNSSVPRKKEESDIKKLRSKVVKNARFWVEKNRGISLKKHDYVGPRISSEFMDCSMPMTFDHYSLCSFGCMYCFSYMLKSSFLKIGSELGSVNVEGFKSLFNGSGKPIHARGRWFYEYFVKNRFLLHWGGMADPFCNFEKAHGVGFELLKVLAKNNYPTLFSTKGSKVLSSKKYLNFFEKYSDQKNFAFQSSIITFDEKLAADSEMGVPSPKERLKTVKLLSDMGYFVILRLRPYIIGITDETIDELLGSALEAGIKSISMEFMAVDSRGTHGVKLRNEWLGHLIGAKNFLHYFSSLSPKERGGYYRLNRLVKEEHVKKVYLFAKKHNLIFACSDPDFKELNMSGSCCGMPDDYKENPGLENWTRSQLTYHLKEMRRKYHLTGENQFLRFEDVYPLNDEQTRYMDQTYFFQDHVYSSDLNASLKKIYTHRVYARRAWNTITSPSNPRNYFHGKLMPVRVDENENYIYKYEESGYEKRWKDDGIDLSTK